MPRSASVSVPKRLSFELEDALPRGVTSPGPREYDSWPCDSFFLLPDAVLTMDAGAFRADLKALDPVLSASLPDWPLEEAIRGISPIQTLSPLIGNNVKSKSPMEMEKRPFMLLHNHKGLLLRSSGKGTVLIGGGGDTTEGSSTTNGGGGLSAPYGTSSTGNPIPATNGPTKTSPPQQESQQLEYSNSFKAASALSKDPSQKDRSSGLSYKDREERVRQLRERQQQERQQKLIELKEQAASAQRFREQQEAARRQRLDDMRSKDSERRCQVEERKRLIQQAEQDRRDAALRKSAEREQRLELKRRQERSNVVFAFGSSTPRMLDPKENIQNYFGARRATSTTNVNLSDSTSSVRRSSECQEPELSRKRATSAHSLNRKPDEEGEAESTILHAKPYRVADLRMSASMYEVFNWDDGESTSPTKALFQTPAQGTRLTKSRDSSVERRPPRATCFRPRASTPDPPLTAAAPFRSVPMSPSTSLSSSNSSDKTLVASQDGSRFSIWEFGDNFAALGPSTPQGAPKGGSGSFLPLSLNTITSSSSHHYATAPTTPISTPHASRRTHSILTGAGSAYGGDEASTQRPFVPPPPTAARRRTDLLPAFPSLRDSNVASSTRNSPRHRSPGRALSLGRLDQLARPRPQRPPSLAPLHETSSSSSPSSREKRMTPARTMSKSMSHLGPQHARTPIGPATDGAGVPIADGSLDRGSSRSSLALAPHPRMTRAEMLKLSKLRGSLNASQGIRSGTVTPGSTSRPTSALSQASGGSQVMLRTRTSPKKPRPLSIAGTTLSSADKPRDSPAVAAPAPASPNRESRSIDRKLSNGTVTSKPVRAKSVGSDRSAPSTPAKTPRGTTPKRTPAQVKAESAAKKAADRSKPTPKLRSTPKTTPLQSPSVESKPLPGSEKIIKKEVKPQASTDVDETPDASLQDVSIEVAAVESSLESEVKFEIKMEETESEVIETVETSEVTQEEQQPQQITEPSPEHPGPEQLDDAKPDTDEEKMQSQGQRAADKPVTGYASEEQYKAALAEKRKQAREAKERELELERQRQFEEEEKERKEEEEYLKLMEEQRKAEDERLQKAIEEAERLRVEEAQKKEEDEKLRIETEKIEQQKKLEAEEKMRKEEEERQMRKSRVAAIMSRTRGKGSAGSTPSKNEPKTPSDESKNLNDSLMSSSMTEALINNLSSSMTDSMIVQAIESHQAQKNPHHAESEQTILEDMDQSPSTVPSVSQPPSDVSSQLLSDVSSQECRSDVDSSISHPESQIISDDFAVTKTSSDKTIPVSKVEDIISGMESVNLLETHMNGNAPPVPMDTTPTSQTVDLLGSFNGVNGISHNGVDSSTFQPSERHDNQFGSLDPFSSSAQTILTTEVSSDPFDQIIDLNQAKLTNEDAVNSNPPPPPIIAFEDNLNRKSQQTHETSSNVPDLLL